MVKIRFGPAGLGSVKDAIRNLEEFKALGLQACEIAFTYGAYIKHEKDAKEIGKAAKKLGIKLSIHAHYWINLNSKEKAKINASKKRILECCRVGEQLGAHRVVFHPGFYAGIDKETTYKNISEAILEMQKIIKEKKWKIRLAPETTGKVNVFGSIDEIAKLVKDTKCEFCIDFAHIRAREKHVDYNYIKQKFGAHKQWHVHFSGIIYGDKGEQKHKKTTKSEWSTLLKNLPKDKEIIIINESPDNVQDSVDGLKLASRH
ncbi:TIM barrel protein [Candidatus Pacearchaeota archaeon]|nr:TIM barrel protein [Candidatus Pacearchaeota archaeon]